MQINKVAFIGKGGVGLLYGSMIAKALGNDAVEYVMDDTRFERHAGDALTVNGKPCDLTSVRASEATPADLVILTVKTTGLDQALKTMERVVGPNTLIASLCNGITSEQKIAERFGWKHTVLGICQGMDAVFLDGALTFTNAGEIRFGAAAGTDPATVAAIDELYTRCGIAHTVEDDIALLDMTLTSAACPLTDVIEDQSRNALVRSGLVEDIKINWVWVPPWGPDKITDDGREQLRALGITV